MYYMYKKVYLLWGPGCSADMENQWWIVPLYVQWVVDPQGLQQHRLQQQRVEEVKWEMLSPWRDGDRNKFACNNVANQCLEFC